jgi:hypothetical protein
MELSLESLFSAVPLRTDYHVVVHDIAGIDPVSVFILMLDANRNGGVLQSDGRYYKKVREMIKDVMRAESI